MTKRLIDIDDELLDAARAQLHTTGISDTVRLALQSAVAMAARAHEIKWLAEGGLSELADRDARAAVWR